MYKQITIFLMIVSAFFTLSVFAADPDITPPVIVFDAPTLVSTGTITDTVITITDDTAIFATGVFILRDSTITYRNFHCDQINITTVVCTLEILTSGYMYIELSDVAHNSAGFFQDGYIVDGYLPDIYIDDDVNPDLNTGDIILVSAYDDYLIQTGSLLYGYSIDNICDSTDQYIYVYNSGIGFLIDDELHNGEYICFQAIDHLGNTSYLSTINPLNIEAMVFIPQSSSGGGGGNSVTKDNCPDGDYTDSYYDNACGIVSEIGTGNIIVDKTIIINYPDTELYNDTISSDYCYNKKLDISIIDSSNIITTTEFKKALSFLYTYDMTIFNNIEEFTPYSYLTREQAAKIFSNFAMNVLCRKPDKNLNITYIDMDNANNTMKNSINLAYQLGLMKGGVDGLFRPQDNITKAEFNAVLIRLILNSYLPENKNDTWYKEYNDVSNNLNLNTSIVDNNVITRHDASIILFSTYKNQSFSLKNIYFNKSFVLDKRDDYIN